MGNLSFHAFAQPWWPYVFILLAGWLPTDIWRYLGVLSSGRIREDSPALGLVRAIATALVAAVIAQLVLYPGGSLAAIPGAVRAGALVVGFLVYLAAGRRIVVGILAAEAVLVGVPLVLSAL
ncbi:AzlD domain-containing protein [Mangrovibrevibacter kandeliae]|uniref:AzlD domain-containing protein n=1 Tax=Mangrovibrevibacter kandeliae TaxID=2968473 RepID=UPI002119B355|nr:MULTISPECIES: AzlD domain-containing protein [unclassified Aurantimonas]MCQ8782559.1 AzlD domain-containing protein [Aurantimonas sp. CSK15Z-1]MCW4114632.1 AzlD domain-containing protein [Aurantimonas sp. MSK8Z-1]